MSRRPLAEEIVADGRDQRFTFAPPSKEEP
jgi:hypothetical protein